MGDVRDQGFYFFIPTMGKFIFQVEKQNAVVRRVNFAPCWLIGHDRHRRRSLAWLIFSRSCCSWSTIDPTWTEDRAMLGSNLSADPGAKTEVGHGVMPRLVCGVDQRT